MFGVGCSMFDVPGFMGRGKVTLQIDIPPNRNRLVTNLKFISRIALVHLSPLLSILCALGDRCVRQSVILGFEVRYTSCTLSGQMVIIQPLARVPAVKIRRSGAKKFEDFRYR